MTRPPRHTRAAPAVRVSPALASCARARNAAAVDRLARHAPPQARLNPCNGRHPSPNGSASAVAARQGTHDAGGRSVPAGDRAGTRRSVPCAGIARAWCSAPAVSSPARRRGGLARALRSSSTSRTPSLGSRTGCSPGSRRGCSRISGQLRCGREGQARRQSGAAADRRTCRRRNAAIRAAGGGAPAGVRRQPGGPPQHGRCPRRSRNCPGGCVGGAAPDRRQGVEDRAAPIIQAASSPTSARVHRRHGGRHHGWADLAVCRFRALSPSPKLCAAGVPALMVPFPAAVGDHQDRNARYAVRAGAALVMAESALTPITLAATARTARAGRPKAPRSMARCRAGVAITDADEATGHACIAAAGVCPMRTGCAGSTDPLRRHRRQRHERASPRFC